MNTIKYTDLKQWYLNNDIAKENAAKYFGDNQPSIHQTGFYSAPSWNWGYFIGIVGVNTAYTPDQPTDIKWFEVVTQFGVVKAAREITLPMKRGA